VGKTIGARNAKQIDGAIGAAAFRLTRDETKEIEANR
jgi:aryl-alcohol dehydrogenase-like predicted oxidoreductase